MGNRVAIVLVNYNGLEDTCDCLDSIQQLQGSAPAVIVVDNASTLDPTDTLTTRFPWCTLVRNSINGGWAGGNNVGIREALQRGCEFVILLNNDTIVSPHLVNRLLEAMQREASLGIVGPVINEFDLPDKVQTEGVVFNTSRESGFFSREHVVQDDTAVAPSITNVDIVNGCCLMIRKGVLESIGEVDERFFLIHEESDFCLRALRAGWKCAVLGKSLVWHKHSASFRRSGQSLQRYYDTRNLQLLLRNHASQHRRGRSVARSWLEYYKYIYYCYCFETEQGSREGSRAIVEGLIDGWFGRYGVRQKRSYWLKPVIEVAFNAARAARRLSPVGIFRTAAPPKITTESTG